MFWFTRCSVGEVVVLVVLTPVENWPAFEGCAGRKLVVHHSFCNFMVAWRAEPLGYPFDCEFVDLQNKRKNKMAQPIQDNRGLWGHGAYGVRPYISHNAEGAEWNVRPDPVDCCNQGGVRSGGFHGAIGGIGDKAQSQTHPLPRRPCAKPPLARGGHTGQAWQRAQEGHQHRTKDASRVSRGNDVGAAAQASFQYWYCGLWPLRWGCQSHRLHWRSGDHWSDSGSPASERAGHACSTAPGATHQSPTWYAAAYCGEGVRVISPDAAEHLVGMDSCGLPPGNDHKRFASGRMRDRFQLVRCQSPDSMHEKHRDTGRKISLIGLLSVLDSNLKCIT